MTEVIISVFGAPQVGKSTLIARCEPIVCPYCIFKQTFKDMVQSMDEEKLKDENVQKDLNEKSKAEASKASSWNIGTITEPKSLKWYCRNVVLTHKLLTPQIISTLPSELVEYINEITAMSCSECQTVYLQNIEKTTKCSYFDKIWNRNNCKNIKIIDTHNFMEIDHQIKRLLTLSSHGYVLVYDVSVKSTFLALEQIAEHIRRNRSENVPIILVGNKNDRHHEVSKDEIEQFSKKFKISVFKEISTMDTNFTSTSLFQEIVWAVYKQMHPYRSTVESVTSTCTII